MNKDVLDQEELVQTLREALDKALLRLESLKEQRDTYLASHDLKLVEEEKKEV